MGLTPKQISKCEWNDFKRIYYTKFQIPELGKFSSNIMNENYS